MGLFLASGSFILTTTNQGTAMLHPICGTLIFSQCFHIYYLIRGSQQLGEVSKVEIIFSILNLETKA